MRNQMATLRILCGTCMNVTRVQDVIGAMFLFVERFLLIDQPEEISERKRLINFASYTRTNLLGEHESMY